MSNDFDTLKTLHGGSQADLARTLGMSAEHASRISTGQKPVPQYVALLVELLEATPRKDWPIRWKAEARLSKNYATE